MNTSIINNPLTLLVVMSMMLVQVACSRSSAPTPATRPAGSSSPSEALVVTPGVGVGSIQFGMTLDDVKKSLGEPDAGTPGRALQYSKLGLAALPRSGSEEVGAIMIGDGTGGPLVDAFKGATKEGIRMRSTREQIVAAFGQPEAANAPRPGLEQLTYDGGKTQYLLKDGALVHIQLRP